MALPAAAAGAAKAGAAKAGAAKAGATKAVPWLAIIGTALKAKGAADQDRAEQQEAYQNKIQDFKNDATQSIFLTRLMRQQDIENAQKNKLAEREAGLNSIGMLAQMREQAMKKKYIGAVRNDLLKVINNGGM